MKKLTVYGSSKSKITASKVKSYFSAVLILLLSFTFIPHQVNADIVGVSAPNSGNFIEVYADVTWAVLSSNSLTLAGFTVLGAQAVTWNSDDLKFYAIVTTTTSNRRLVIVNPSSGVCTDIGDMGGQYSTLTYSSTTGTLYTMGGAGGGAIAERLYSVNITTAATTFLGGPYSLGADGEVIAYNYDDGFIYHWSGNATANMEKINLTTFAATPVVQSGLVHNEIFGAVYQGGGRFLATDINNNAITITSAGVVALQASGLVFEPRGLGYVDALLPVELASFTSSVSSNEVTLNWSTATETNNSGFDIERSNVRSQTSNEWIKVGNVAGNGTSTVSNSYSFTDRNLTSGNYSYRLKQIDFNGNFEYFNLSNEVNVGIPSEFELSQNYPNPFNPSTNLEFGISELGFVSLKIYNTSGMEIATLVNEIKTAGYYSVNFNASSLSSGVYFYSISADNFTATKKMLLVK